MLNDGTAMRNLFVGVIIGLAAVLAVRWVGRA